MFKVINDHKNNLIEKIKRKKVYKSLDKVLFSRLVKAVYWSRNNKIASFSFTSLLWLSEMFIITIIGILISFFIINSIPADPPFLVGLNEAQKVVVKAQYGLDLPLIEQFGNYLANLFQGNLGISYAVFPQKPISDFLFDRLAVSLVINIFATVLGLGVGLVLGLVLGQKPGGLLDGATSIVLAVVYATPGILVAIYVLLIGRGIGIEYIFSRSNPETYILPVISLSVFSIASYIRYIRAELSVQLKSQHAKFAYLKGVSKTRFLFKHALKPSIFPIATFLPEALLTSFIGSFVVERIFTIPGSGSLILDAINTSDTNVVLSIFIITTLLSVLAFRLRDILYRVLDPRIRKKGA